MKTKTTYLTLALLVLLLGLGALAIWLRGRGDSPWYPSARLYRQPRIGDWPGVLKKVRRDLKAWS